MRTNGPHRTYPIYTSNRFPVPAQAQVAQVSVPPYGPVLCQTTLYGQALGKTQPPAAHPPAAPTAHPAARGTGVVTYQAQATTARNQFYPRATYYVTVQGRPKFKVPALVQTSVMEPETEPAITQEEEFNKQYENLVYKYLSKPNRDEFEAVNWFSDEAKKLYRNNADLRIQLFKKAIKDELINTNSISLFAGKEDFAVFLHLAKWAIAENILSGKDKLALNEEYLKGRLINKDNVSNFCRIDNSSGPFIYHLYDDAVNQFLPPNTAMAPTTFIKYATSTTVFYSRNT